MVVTDNWYFLKNGLKNVLELGGGDDSLTVTTLKTSDLSHF